jgi:glutamate-1-semialdehyde 2,1-aminomutase
MSLTHGPLTHQFYERAKQVLPYGVNSNMRYWSDDSTPVVARAQGGYVYDFDGRRYIDYRLAFGPIILGHADSGVNQRVAEAIQNGTSFASTHELEVRAAERIVDLCPSVEMVRLVNSGSEATMHALRLARGYTGRDIILKFEGSYHGAHDQVLWSTTEGNPTQVGQRQRPTGFKQSKGLPDVLRGLIQLCPWNDVEVLGDILQERGEQIAGLIIEPILGNSAAMMPRPGYLEFVREQCDRYGIVLIFDEVKTGFRIAPGGAGEFFGVSADLSTFAKALGNGFPVAAIGGKKELMMNLIWGKVMHAGTYCGNMVAAAAADATLERIQGGEVFPQIEKIGRMLMDGIDEILTRYGLPHFVHGMPGMFGYCLLETRPYDWRDLMEADWETQAKIMSHMVQNGIMCEDGPEPFFICAAHSEADAAETLEKFEDAVKSVISG